MGEARRRILQMLSDGIITAEEANNLLGALGPDDRVKTVAGSPILTSEVAADEPQVLPPNLERLRRLWMIPLIIAAGSLFLSGLGLLLLYQSTAQVAFLGFLCLWSIFLLALVGTVVLVLARRSTWLYMRVEEREGTRFSLGLPIPLGLVNWAIRVARPFVPDEQAAYLETAATFVTAMKNNPDGEPILIDVDDEDGDKVQIYIG